MNMLENLEIFKRYRNPLYWDACIKIRVLGNHAFSHIFIRIQVRYTVQYTDILKSYLNRNKYMAKKVIYGAFIS